jgi:hypothetical protein
MVGSRLLDRAAQRCDGGEIRKISIRLHGAIIDRPLARHKTPLGQLPFIWLNAFPDLGAPGYARPRHRATWRENALI